MSEPFMAEIKMFGGNFAPRGYAMCAGQIMSIAQNTALFSLLGTTFGGNGQSTFGLPSLVGRVPVGQGVGQGAPNVNLGEVGGASTATLSTQQIPAHSHALRASQSAGTQNAPQANSILAQSNQRDAQFIDGGNAGTIVQTSPASTGPAGGSQPFSIMQPYLGITFIIALNGVFPSRN